MSHYCAVSPVTLMCCKQLNILSNFFHHFVIVQTSKLVHFEVHVGVFAQKCDFDRVKVCKSGLT